MRGHLAYKRGIRVDKACYYIFRVLFVKDLKRFETIWFEPVSSFKRDNMAKTRVFASTGGLFIRNSKDRRIS